MTDSHGNKLLRQIKSPITSLSDRRLVKIDPQVEGFYDLVLNCSPKHTRFKLFIEDIKKLKELHLEAFYMPIYAPSKGTGDMPIVFESGKEPAVNYSYIWWLEIANCLPNVEGKTWKLANIYFYYAFVVFVINNLVSYGLSVESAFEKVVLTDRIPQKIKPTGSNCTGGFYDINTTYKLTSGFEFINTPNFPFSTTDCMISICHSQMRYVEEKDPFSVGLLILI